MLPTGRTFMEQTRYEFLSASDQTQGLPAPPLEKAVPEDHPIIPLPRHENLQVPPIDCRTAIESRRSIRHYARDPLTLDELAFLCWNTQGIVEVKAPYYTLRNVPSAGGRHAFETYLLINRVGDLQPGLYRYLAFSHSLALVEIGSGMTDRIMSACLGQAFVRSSAVTFVWSAVIYRMAWRYSERAYRLVHLDAGHVCQNLYLAGEQIGCGTCAIGAFDDRQMADVLGIDGEEEFVVYCATVGKKGA
ncbi:MAG: nitroreductase [Methanomicrobiales archaeon HGW-Methanomicrobiales-1]|jgi:SagB-type dehydrogenase family enzyme|nr:MAG: nitroreductase [Methanomicrobiales archaeon HGW-Methanomicrobiales-1]